MIRILFLCFLFLGLAPLHAAAQSILTPSEFRDAAIAMIEAENPDAQVTLRDELGITVRASAAKDANEFQVNFDSGYNEYLSNPLALNDILHRWAQFAAGPPTDGRQLVRIVSILRPMSTVHGYGATIAQAERPSALVWRPFAGDVAEVLVFDSPDSVEFVTELSLSDLGVSIAAAWEAAPRNLPSRLGELEMGGIEGADRLVYVTGGNGLSPSVLIGGGLCERDSQHYYLLLDRNAFLVAEATDSVAEQQMRDLMDDMRRNGGLYSESLLTCRNGAVVAIALTD